MRKTQLREAARYALDAPGHNYETQQVLRPGIVVGSRLRATNKPQPYEIAIRTSLDREIGFLRHPDGRWRTLPSVQEVVVAVPSRSDTGQVEVFGFDPNEMLAIFDAAVSDAGRKLAMKAPIFISLDEVKAGKKSGPIAGGLKQIAKWELKVDLGSLAKSPNLETTEFIDRVKREFAEIIGVDAKNIAIEFRIVV